MKTILITGSSGLIGNDLCQTFLNDGYKVYGLDLKEGTLKHHHFTFLQCDLSKESSIKKALKSIKSLDGVVNNAAATHLSFISFEKTTLKDWEQGLAINVTAVFIIAKLTYPLLKKNKGCMINISSTRHLMSEPNTVLYSASKGAIASLTHSLAITWGPDVRVNTISPGWIDNPQKKFRAKDHKQHPAGRVGVPQDISQMALFLASDKSSFITGQDFIVDGGMTKKMIYEE